MRERAETMLLLILQSVGGTLQSGAEGASEAILHSRYKPTTGPYKTRKGGFRGDPFQKQHAVPLQAASQTSSGSGESISHRAQGGDLGFVAALLVAMATCQRAVAPGPRVATAPQLSSARFRRRRAVHWRRAARALLPPH